MWKQCVVIAAGLLAAAPGPAQTPEQAKREAKNWNVLHELYPKRALAAKEEGLVGFVVTLDAGGHPTECQVTHTSGHKLLDQETCQLIMIHAVFKRPAGLSASQTSKHEGVVNWKLPTTPLAAVPDRPKRIAAGEAPEKMICKRNTRIGTLAGVERTCMTKSEWDRMSDETKQFWKELQGAKGTTSGN